MRSWCHWSMNYLLIRLMHNLHDRCKIAICRTVINLYYTLLYYHLANGAINYDSLHLCKIGSKQLMSRQWLNFPSWIEHKAMATSGVLVL